MSCCIFCGAEFVAPRPFDPVYVSYKTSAFAYKKPDLEYNQCLCPEHVNDYDARRYAYGARP